MFDSTDTRGQANWVGFVLLLAVLATSFTLYQTTVVPEQNAEVEFQHQQAVETDLQQFDHDVHAVARRGGTLPVTVDLGVRYPPRALARNPPPATGSLRTAGEGRVRVFVDGIEANVSRTCRYGDRPVRTRALVYRPSYNVRDAPNLRYEYGLRVAIEDGTVTRVQGDTSLVTDETIRLTPLARNYSASSSTPVELTLHGGRAGRLELADRNVSVSIPTAIPADRWAELLANEPKVVGVSQEAPDRVRIDLMQNDRYTLLCHAVGLGRAPPSGTAALGSGVRNVTTTTNATITSVTVDDRTSGDEARFDASYSVDNFDTGDEVRVTFVHPTKDRYTEEFVSTNATDTIVYQGGKNSRYATGRTDAEYNVTIEVHNSAGEVVASDWETEVANGTDDPG